MSYDCDKLLMRTSVTYFRGNSYYLETKGYKLQKNMSPIILLRV